MSDLGLGKKKLAHPKRACMVNDDIIYMTCACIILYHPLEWKSGDELILHNACILALKIIMNTGQIVRQQWHCGLCITALYSCLYRVQSVWRLHQLC